MGLHGTVLTTHILLDNGLNASHVLNARKTGNIGVLERSIEMFQGEKKEMFQGKSEINELLANKRKSTIKLTN